MSDFNLIMISAMYENGGNTVHRMLDGHPRLFVYPFESQVGTGAGADHLSSFVPIRYRWPEFPGDATPELAYEMFWDEELKTLLRVPQRSKFRDCQLAMDESARKEAFCKVMEDRPALRRSFVEAYFRATFEAWQNLSRSGEETHYVGYNPLQVLDTDKIFRDFPECHVLHVVRNPFSGYADTVKRPFPLSLDRYVWSWNLCQHMALTYQKKYQGHFHVLRFEDLVADPQAALGRVLTKMGLPFSERCLSPSFNGERLEETRPWGTIRIPTVAANLDTANQLGPDERLRVQTEAAVLLPLLGYEDIYEQAAAAAVER